MVVEEVVAVVVEKVVEEVVEEVVEGVSGLDVEDDVGDIGAEL